MFKFLIILATGCVLTACNSPISKGNEVFQTSFPQDVFASYFAGSEQGVVFTYVSTAGDTLNFHTTYHNTSFTPYIWNEEWEDEEEIPDSSGWEFFHSTSRMNALENGNIQLTWEASCNMRQHLGFSYTVIAGEGKEQSIKGTFADQREQSTNDIFSVLTDTITMSTKNETGENRITGKFLKNKGLVWFVDYNGTEWTLVGQSQGNLDGLTDEEKAVLSTPLPKENIAVFFPYEAGDSLAYVSSKKEVLRFCVKESSDYFTPYEDCNNRQDGNCEYKEEYFSQSCELETQDLQFSTLKWTLSCRMRSRINVSYYVSATGNNMRGNFEYDAPFTSNESFSVLSDSIYLKYYKEDTKPNGLIVKGKGLLWFLDKSGEKWTLKQARRKNI